MKMVMLTLAMLGSALGSTVAATQDNLGVSPPSQKGRNKEAPVRGSEFTGRDADNLADFHGSTQNPTLARYVSGNYFFAIAR